MVNGAVDADGFEGATSDWTPTEEPPRSPPSPANWRIGPSLVNFLGGVATEDSLLLGFGLEHLSTDAERADLVERALDGLLE